MFTWSVLEGATNIGARTGKVGYPNGGDRTQFIRDEVEQLSGGYLDPAALNFTVTSFNDFSQFTYADHTDTANYEQCINPSTPPCPGKPGVNFVDSNGDGVWDQLGTPGTGNAGQTVLYKVTYAYPIFTPLMAQFFGNIFEISAIAAIKNEQFP